MVDVLSEQQRTDLRLFVDSNPDGFRWASGCSGTELPWFSYCALKESFQISGLCRSCSFIHTAGAEIYGKKRYFLKAVHPTIKQLLSNVYELVLSDGWDHVTESKCKVDMEFLEALIMGFSCRTASLLARGTGEGMTCIDERHGQTSFTFDALKLILKQWLPETALLENVAGLLRGDQAASVMEELGQIGYSSTFERSSPHEFAVPHHCGRLWFYF